MSKQVQTDLPFARPGELPLFGPTPASPEPFQVPDFPLEPEGSPLEPGPEAASEREPAVRYLVRGGALELDHLEGKDLEQVRAQVDAINRAPFEPGLPLDLEPGPSPEKQARARAALMQRVEEQARELEPEAPAPAPRRRSKRPLYYVPCEGPEGTGCPRPGCPADAVRTVVYRPDLAPVVRTLCHWCWMAERDAYPLPCSACGAVGEYVKHFSRWWHLSGPAALMDACGACLRPFPGACMDCTGSDNWVTLTNGEFPDFPGDCTCWRAREGIGAPLAATVPEVLAILEARKQDAQRAALAAIPQQSLFAGGDLESES